MPSTKGNIPTGALPTRIILLTLLSGLMVGCDGGVLDPAGPVGSAERVILLDSLAIMLAIVVPTIVCTSSFAWWYRASNRRALYAPQWAYSGRLELLVWSIPALVILFLGGTAWIGSHDLDPAEALEPEQQAARDRGRRTRLEVAIHLSRAAHRQHESNCRTGRYARALSDSRRRRS